MRMIRLALVLLLLPSATFAQGLQLRLGAFLPRGGGNFWSDTEDAFTLKHSDFREGTVGAALLVARGPLVEIGMDVSYFGADVVSATRGYEDRFGEPIEHDTALREVPLMVDIRLHPLRHDSGQRQRSRGGDSDFYIGGGVGANFWSYEETGRFVDRVDESIYVDRFRDSGTAFAAHALAGVVIPFGHALGLNFEARYLWSEADLGGDYRGLGKLDLSATSLTGGVVIQF